MNKRHRILTHKRVDKFLESHQNVALLYLRAIEKMEWNPFDSSLDIKRLVGTNEPIYRLRIGKYRFIFSVLEDQVLIYFFDAGSRGKIYK